MAKAKLTPQAAAAVGKVVAKAAKKKTPKPKGPYAGSVYHPPTPKQQATSRKTTQGSKAAAKKVKKRQEKTSKALKRADKLEEFGVHPRARAQVTKRDVRRARQNAKATTKALQGLNAANSGVLDFLHAPKTPRPKPPRVERVPVGALPPGASLTKRAPQTSKTTVTAVKLAKAREKARTNSTRAKDLQVKQAQKRALEGPVSVRDRKRIARDTQGKIRTLQAGGGEVIGGPIAEAARGAEKGTIEALKFISRPAHGVLRAADYALSEVQKGHVPNVGSTLSEGAEGLVGDPDRQPLGSDILRRLGIEGAPGAVGGFALDVIFDPLTWVTLGAEPIAAHAAVSAARSAERKALKLGLTKTQATAFAERAARKSLKTSEAAGKTNRGLTIKVGGSKRNLKVPGVQKTTAYASRKTGSSRGAKVLKEGPEEGKPHLLDPVGKRTSKAAQATRRVNPTQRERGMSAADNKTAARVGAQERGIESRRQEEILKQALKSKKQVTPERWSNLVDRIEDGTWFHALTGKEHKLAEGLVKTWGRLAKEEYELGLLGRRQKNYVPHILKEDVAKEYENLKPLINGKLGSSARRKYEESLAEHHGRVGVNVGHEVEEKFIEDPAELLVQRAAPSLTAQKHAHIANALMRTGRAVKRTGNQLREGEAIFRHVRGRLEKVTDKNEIEAIIRRQEEGYTATARANVRAADKRVAELRKGVLARNPTLAKRLKEATHEEERKHVLRQVDRKSREIQEIHTRTAPDRLVNQTNGQYRILDERLVNREIYRDAPLNSFGRKYNKLNGHWKASVTLWSIVHHSKNQIGDLWKLHNEAGVGEMAYSYVRQMSPKVRALRAVEAKKVGVQTGGAMVELNRLLNKSGQMSGLGKGSRFARGVAGGREDVNRMAAFDLFRRRGDTPEEAAANVRNLLIDYSTRTEWERKYVKHVLPFYIFAFRNLPQQVKYLAKKPGRFANVELLAEEGARAAGLPKDWRDHLEEYEKRGSFPIPLFGLEDADGNPLFGNVPLPLTDLNKLNPLDLAQNLLQSITPVLKLPVELAANHSFYYGGPIDEQETIVIDGQNVTSHTKVSAPAVVGFMPKDWRDSMGVELLHNDQTGEDEWKWPAHYDYSIKQVPTISFLLQLMTPGKSRRGQTPLTAATNALGIRAVSFDIKDRKEQLAQERLSKMTATRNYLDKRGQKNTPEYKAATEDIRKAKNRIYRLRRRGGWAELPKSYKPRRRGPEVGSGPGAAFEQRYAPPATTTDSFDKRYGGGDSKKAQSEFERRFGP